MIYFQMINILYNDGRSVRRWDAKSSIQHNTHLLIPYIMRFCPHALYYLIKFVSIYSNYTNQP